MIGLRNRSGLLAERLPSPVAPVTAPNFFAEAIGENEIPFSQFDSDAGRSAEFCPAHLRAKHFGSSQAKHPSRRSRQSKLSSRGTCDPKRARIYPILCGELLVPCWGDVALPPATTRQAQEREPRSLAVISSHSGA
jgi:hypothetical protein